MSWAHIRRMWINQPSSAQPLHSLHGERVLAAPESDGPESERVFFLAGPVASMRVPALALSPGWPEEEDRR